MRGEEPNRYRVLVERAAPGWVVKIQDPTGGTAAERSCGDAGEARTYASTVRQHIYWLSEQKFREYYRLADALHEPAPDVGET